jgi:hypothetical protein
MNKGALLIDLITAAEHLANDTKLPGRIMDYGVLIYDQLADRKAQVYVADLIALERYMLDGDLTLIDRRIVEMESLK